VGRGPGRPRDPQAGDAILTATLGQLAEHGYERLTVDGIAEAAGVSKATIYRRWTSKREVVLAAAGRLAEAVPAPDTGSLRGDLKAIVGGLADVFSAQNVPALVGALVAEAVHDADLAATVREGFVRTRRAAAVAALERASARGEIGDNVDVDLTVDLLAAPFYYRSLVTGAPIDDRYAGAVLDAVLATIA
jgi:AcrR family transcriptional regulator